MAGYAHLKLIDPSSRLAQVTGELQECQITRGKRGLTKLRLKFTGGEPFDSWLAQALENGQEKSLEERRCNLFVFRKAGPQQCVLDSSFNLGVIGGSKSPFKRLNDLKERR